MKPAPVAPATFIRTAALRVLQRHHILIGASANNGRDTALLRLGARQRPRPQRHRQYEEEPRPQRIRCSRAMGVQPSWRYSLVQGRTRGSRRRATPLCTERFDSPGFDGPARVSSGDAIGPSARIREDEAAPARSRAMEPQTFTPAGCTTWPGREPIQALATRFGLGAVAVAARRLMKTRPSQARTAYPDLDDSPGAES